MTAVDDEPVLRFEATRGSLRWFWVMALLTVALLVAAVVLLNPHCAIAAILPGLIAIALFFASRAEGAIALAADRITLNDDPEYVIPYVDIEGLRVDGKAADLSTSPGFSSSVEVEHKKGTLRIPLGGGDRADAVLGWLKARIPVSGSRTVHGSLEPYLNEQLRDFGPERVFSYSTAVGLRRGKPMRSTGRLIAGAMLGTSILWIGLGIVLSDGLEPRDREIYDAWTAWGTTLLITGLLTYFATFSQGRGGRRQAARKLKNASLVISPLGLAMAQGDLQGHVPWDELRDVNLRLKPPRMQLASSQNSSRIELRMAGAVAEIYDIYDRPLSLIRDRIVAYWKG